MSRKEGRKEGVMMGDKAARGDDLEGRKEGRTDGRMRDRRRNGCQGRKEGF